MQEDNVRVAVRVRPILPKEKLAGEQLCVKIISSTKQVVLGKDRAFTFDHVISSKTSQDDVYEKCVEPLVKACFEGYNATVFAYGQTGSGKTYTVGGGNISSLTEDEYGIIPRAIKQMYEIIQTNPNREYTARVSYVEIYKEELCDLLDLETSSKDLHIREDDKGNTLIMGATELECQTMDEVMTCLEQGSAYRHTGSTQMNEHSSRSHSVFTVSIEQRWSDSDVPLSARPKDDDCEEVIDDPGEIIHNMCAKFHFVDLAGSERAHRTGNVGDRFKESVHINSGLLALGNVISALGDVKKKSTHIPYRDSKITRLLKDSLGGNAKTLMICCISPVVSSFDESLNALKYANRARNIKNKPIINRDVQSIRFEEMQSEIKALREELQRQRTSMFTTSDFDSQKATQDAEVVKAMEDKVVSLQTECSHYRMIAEEAYKQLLDIQQRDILSQSQNVRLGDWMELMEEIKHQVPATLNKDEWENQTIIRLQEELKQCRNDLRSDEEIFAEKTKELSNLYDRIAELESMSEESDHRLQEALDRQKQQEEQLVAQQVKIEELNQKLKQKEVSLESSQCDLDSSSRSLGPPTTSRRAKSVPAHMVGNRSARAPDVPPRNIHTSPALFSLDRVMQSFRARSNLIVSRLEDDDDVLQQAFSDEEQRPGGSDGEEGQEAVDGKEAFQRGEQKRGTYTVKKSASVKRTSTYKLQKRDLHGRQTDDEKISVRNGEDVENVNPDGQSVRKSKNHDMMNGDEPGWKQSQAQRSTERQMKQLKYSQLEVQQSTQKLKDLSINIRMKEQLIKELVKTGKEAQHVNKQYADKIKTLEKEKLAAKQELVSLQKAMQDIEAKEQQENVEKEKLQKEFRKKMEKAKTRIHDLQKKQKETEKMASLTGQNDKRIQDLEMAIDRMKNQQDGLQRRLKEELDRKVKLEREMQREQQRVKELEIKNEQQKKVLRIKTEEMTAMQRKLRTGNQLTPPSEEQTKLEEQKRWLDSELEKVLEQRQQMESLQKDLQRREEILMKKEAMLSERSELEMKKLRSSQVLNKDIITVANKLELMDRQIEEKNQEMNTTPEDHKKQVKEEIKSLQQGRDRLRKQRAVIDTKLKDGTILSGQEERRLIELDEAVEALDAAIEYKNEAIVARQQELRKSAMLTQSEDNLMAKLNSLTSTETKTLLSRYFEKVIDLREDEHRKELQCSELEMKIDEQERMIRELQGTMQRAAMETDRKLTHQQQEYEKKIQLLMKQLSEADGASSSGGSGRSSATGDPDVVKDAKIQQLEKDLYYYKKTSRDLKKKLREVLAGHIGGDVDRDDTDLGPTPRDVNSPKPATPRLNDIHSTKGLPSARSEAGGRENHNSDRLNNGSVRSNTSARSHKEDLPNRGGMSARTERQAEEPGSSRRHSSEKEDDVFSARDKGGDGANTTVTPIKISRKDLRRMSEEEVHLRKSAASQNSPRLADSLETSRNPWT